MRKNDNDDDDDEPVGHEALSLWPNKVLCGKVNKHSFCCSKIKAKELSHRSAHDSSIFGAQICLQPLYISRQQQASLFYSNVYRHHDPDDPVGR